MKKKSLTNQEIAKLIAGFASDKKAEDIVILDMQKVANFCDFFVVCSGTSTRQVRGIAEGIIDGLEEIGIKIRFKQGLKEGRWALLDLGSIVAHVFDGETRSFYELDYLWQEAGRITFEE